MTKVLPVPLPEDLHRRLKLFAVNSGTTMTAIVKQAIMAYMGEAQEEPKQPTPKRLSADYSFGEAPQDTPAPPKNRVRLEDIPGIRL